MTDFKAKMHQIRFRLGLRPRPRWESLQRSPRPPSWISEPLCGRGRAGLGRGGKGEGKGREGEVKGREREVPKLLLNQCPSATCYATADTPFHPAGDTHNVTLPASVVDPLPAAPPVTRSGADSERPAVSEGVRPLSVGGRRWWH